MDKINHIKKRISDLCSTYKIIATMSTLAIRLKQYSVVFAQHKELKKVFSDIVETVNINYSKEIKNKVINLDIESLPDELSSLVLVKTYNEILALQYSSLFGKNLKNNIKLHQMSLELNPTEGIIHYNMAVLLQKSKKYDEVIDFCKKMIPMTNSQSLKNILADTYEKIGEIGEAIKLHREYFQKNEGDVVTKNKLNELYRKALK